MSSSQTSTSVSPRVHYHKFGRLRTGVTHFLCVRVYVKWAGVANVLPHCAGVCDIVTTYSWITTTATCGAAERGERHMTTISAHEQHRYFHSAAKDRSKCTSCMPDYIALHRGCVFRCAESLIAGIQTLLNAPPGLCARMGASPNASELCGWPRGSASEDHTANTHHVIYISDGAQSGISPSSTTLDTYIHRQTLLRAHRRRCYSKCWNSWSGLLSGTANEGLWTCDFVRVLCAPRMVRDNTPNQRKENNGTTSWIHLGKWETFNLHKLSKVLDISDNSQLICVRL